jgi:branched-chain amino acid transport system permease protein
VVEWSVFLRHLGGQELGQVLTTMGIALIFQDLGLIIWGGEPYTIRMPAGLSGSYQIGSLFFPVYRLFIIAVALVVGVILWVVLERTRLGAMIRATVDDAEMARGVGIHVPLISMGVFALGAGLAAVAGVVAGGFVGVYPGADFEILPYAFVVVIVGGMGSIPGAAVGALLIGLAEQFGLSYAPTYGVVFTFLIMVLVLAFRPTGILGRRST